MTQLVLNHLARDRLLCSLSFIVLNSNHIPCLLVFSSTPDHKEQLQPTFQCDSCLDLMYMTRKLLDMYLIIVCHPRHILASCIL